MLFATSGFVLDRFQSSKEGRGSANVNKLNIFRIFVLCFNPQKRDGGLPTGTLSRMVLPLRTSFNPQKRDGGLPTTFGEGAVMSVFGGFNPQKRDGGLPTSENRGNPIQSDFVSILKRGTGVCQL